MTRQRDLEFSDLVKAKCPLLHQAIMHIGHRQTRNRGTIGGSLCHLDPAAELVSVCAAHDATVTVAGPNGTREIAFADFPAGYLTPAIELNEIVTDDPHPALAGRPQGGVRRVLPPPRRFRHRVGGGAAADRRRQDQPRLGHHRRRRGRAGARHRGRDRPSPARRRRASLFAKACESCRSIEAMADIHASADYRQHLAAVLSRRALEKAAGLADNAPWNRAH